MNEYEELKKFIKDECKQNIIDITDKLTLFSYKYYTDLAIKHPTNVYIAKKTLKSAKLFGLIASITTDETHKAKYLLLKNDNYHISCTFQKAAISKFVLATDDNVYECGICKNLSIFNNICGNCTFQICGCCAKSLYLTSNFKCPQCRVPYEIYDNEPMHNMLEKYSSEYKFNVQ